MNPGSAGNPSAREAKEFFVRCRDAYIHCQAIGALSAEEPTLVFLHDALGSNAQWKDFPDLIARRTGLSAFLFERRGHGLSSAHPGARTLSYLHEEASLLPIVLEQAGIRRPVLIGHSDGGSIALLARVAPAHVECIVTIAAHVLVDEVMIRGIHLAAEAYQSTDLRERLFRYHGEKTDSLFGAWAGLSFAPEFRTWNIEREISHVTCPVLVIQGSKDEYTGSRQPEVISRRVSGPVRIEMIPDCGHSPHLQAKGLLVELISDFIRAQLSPK